MWSLQASLHLPGAALLRLRKLPTRYPDNGPVNAGGGASMLGVGHFTVPPDVIVEGPAGVPPSDGAGSQSTIRTIVVPHGIAAVPRRSPIKARKRTPWHPVPEAQGVVERADSREWFSDRLIVKSKQTHLPAACTTSAMVHFVIVILVLLLLAARAARADLTPGTQVRTQPEVSLRMPVTMSLMPAAVTLLPARKTVEGPSLAPDPRPAPRPALAVETPAAAPLEAPSGVEAEPMRLDDATRDGAEVSAGVDAATDGVVSGVADGTSSGSSVGAAAPAEASGPFRVGDGIARPRKIKDVKPVYPQPAMASQAMGTVLIEATIGADGKVHNARVLRSVAALDQAALDAVRQWEYEPSRLNGVAVAVTMVIVVTFSLL